MVEGERVGEGWGEGVGGGRGQSGKGAVDQGRGVVWEGGVEPWGEKGVVGEGQLCGELAVG